jgi:hypothetical protein
MFGMSTDVMMSLLRHLLTFVGGLIVAKGWMSADVMAQLSGALVTIAGALFASFFHAQSNGIIPTLSTTSNMIGATNVGSGTSAQ